MRTILAILRSSPPPLPTITSTTDISAIVATAGKPEKKRKRKQRPKHLPKGRQSANFLYFNANRPRVREQNPDADNREIVS